MVINIWIKTASFQKNKKRKDDEWFYRPMNVTGHLSAYKTIRRIRIALVAVIKYIWTNRNFYDTLSNFNPYFNYIITAV